MKLLIPKILVVSALLLLAPASADAVEFGFSCVTNNSPMNCLAGQAQFAVDIEETPAGLVRFDFKNLGPEPSSMAEIYFDGAPTLASISAIVNSAGTKFAKGGTPSNLPGGHPLNPEFEADFWVTAKNPAPFKGVNPLEHVQVVFALAGGMTFDDVIGGMESGAIRLGVHAVAWADGKSDSFVSEVRLVPEAPVIALFGAALPLTALLLRRQRYRLRAAK